MKISIIGTGYVGIVTGLCFAECCHNITFMDGDKKKIANINNGRIAIYEPGINRLLEKNKEACLSHHKL